LCVQRPARGVDFRSRDRYRGPHRPGVCRFGVDRVRVFGLASGRGHRHVLVLVDAGGESRAEAAEARAGDFAARDLEGGKFHMCAVRALREQLGVPSGDEQADLTVCGAGIPEVAHGA
jgi:hypothetical protein